MTHAPMINTLARIRSVSPLPDGREAQLAALLQPVELKKGHVLFREGKTDRDVYFIENGIARAYCNLDAAELTFWFGMEGDILISYNGYIKGTAGYESIELLEPALLHRLPFDDLESLYRSDIHFANWGRKLMEKEVILTEERFISRQFRSAAERYHELTEQSPALLQRVRLGQIASYLGITQVTLSRIRAGK
ncbi:Crp/Fnr family transcriptional regulator [Chitinophaga lutea]